MPQFLHVILNVLKKENFMPNSRCGSAMSLNSSNSRYLVFRIHQNHHLCGADLMLHSSNLGHELQQSQVHYYEVEQ
ncbi:hypothetical protein Syun_029329 [Stephania yunnanensis]|uniref:Uncharacterized protein n=1 Tax=Stephania yunnanensis TaxID=152371 RepID=A0AAP0E559_9MAGN